MRSQAIRRLALATRLLERLGPENDALLGDLYRGGAGRSAVFGTGVRC